MAEDARSWEVEVDTELGRLKAADAQNVRFLVVRAAQRKRALRHLSQGLHSQMLAGDVREDHLASVGRVHQEVGHLVAIGVALFKVAMDHEEVTVL